MRIRIQIFTLIWIRIQLFTLMWIRIKLPKTMRIQIRNPALFHSNLHLWQAVCDHSRLVNRVNNIMVRPASKVQYAEHKYSNSIKQSNMCFKTNTIQTGRINNIF